MLATSIHVPSPASVVLLRRGRQLHCDGDPMRPCHDIHPEPMTTGCHLCGLYLTDDAFRRLWDGSPALPAVASVMPSRPLPCIHEGAVLNFCPRGDELLHVRDCDKDHENVTRGGRCFAGCGDYTFGFDRTVVINLKRRPDRLARFQAEFKGSPFGTPEVVEAVDGHTMQPPASFQSGAGAFGCKQSHVQVLNQATGSLLVFEDDAFLMEDGWERMKRFLRDVPSDWDQLMLGGQHMAPVEEVSPGVVRVTNCQRTHAYAIRGPFLKHLLNTWIDCPVHIDWRMGDEQKNWNVYAPKRFIFGQAGGQSDIVTNEMPRKTWDTNPHEDRIVLLRSTRVVAAELRMNHGWWGGAQRDPDTDIDVGLIDASLGYDKQRTIHAWINLVGSEAGGVLFVRHPEITLAELQAATSRRVILIEASSSEDAIREYDK